MWPGNYGFVPFFEKNMKYFNMPRPVCQTTFRHVSEFDRYSDVHGKWAAKS